MDRATQTLYIYSAARPKLNAFVQYRRKRNPEEDEKSLQLHWIRRGTEAAALFSELRISVRG
jgi:hypothetical protein